MHQRTHYLNQIHNALKQDKLVLLLGTRQVGKTTLMKQIQTQRSGSSTWYINLEEYFGLNFTTKQSFVQFLQGELGCNLTEPGSLLLLDEVQSIKHIEVLLKSLYDDEHIKSKIIATGSRFWGQTIVGSTLVGRGKQIFVYPLSFREYLAFQGKYYTTDTTIEFQRIKDHLTNYMQFGGYPGVVSLTENKQKYDLLNTIISRIFEKDFSYFLKSDDLVDCRKVFQRIVANTGNSAKIEAIAYNLSLSAYKVQKFITLLQKSYLIYCIYPYHIDQSKEYSNKPKLYIYDPGIYNIISGNKIIDMHDGKMNEMLSLHQLLMYNNPDKIMYYKKDTGSEIDFIVQQYTSLQCIEIKSQDNTNIPKIFFHTDFPHKEVTYHKTTQSLYDHKIRDHISCEFIPWRDLQHIYQS